MNGNEWAKYVYDLHQYVTEQGEMIKDLESKLTKMEQDIQNKNNKTVDKIEYNFDQLKIEHLDGTLHIGLTPKDLANIEDIGIPQNKQVEHPQPIKQKILAELQSYLQDSGPGLIRDAASRYHYPVDDAYESMLIQDMQKQLPHRIAFYEQEAKKQTSIKTDEQLQSYITEQVKHEIHHSLSSYMQTNEQKGDES